MLQTQQMAILFFVMIIFGITGEGIFQGSLHYHCATNFEYNLYLEAKEEEGEAHRRRALDFRFARSTNGLQTPRFGAEDAGLGYSAGLRLGEEDGDTGLEFHELIHGTASSASRPSGSARGSANPKLEGEGEDRKVDGLTSEAAAVRRRASAAQRAPGRRLKGGGSPSNFRPTVRRSPPPPPPESAASAAPIAAAAAVSAVAAAAAAGDTTCDPDDPETFNIELCCPLPDNHRQLRRGRSLKGGGGGGGEAEYDPCNPSFSPGDAPFCNINDPNSCAASGLPDATCRYFPEATSLNDFDSVMNAGMVISQIVTLDTWSGAMYDVMLAFSPHVWVYFLLAVLIGGFFIVNLFLGVVFDEFMRAKATEVAKAEMTQIEKQMLEEKDVQEDRMHAKDRSSPNAVDEDGFHRLEDEGEPQSKGEGGVQWLKPIVASESFISITLLFLCINVVLMCAPYAGQPDSRTEMLHSFSSLYSLRWKRCPPCTNAKI